MTKMDCKMLGLETEFVDSDQEKLINSKELGLEKEFMNSDQEDDGGDDDDEKQHAQLLDAIASLGGQHKPRLTQRTIPGSQVSEFSFGTSEEAGKVKLTDLVKSLKNTTKHGRLKKQLRSVQKQNKVVPAPLSKLETERLQRSIAYESTKAEVTKWHPVVIENRKASQITFPLNQTQLQLLTTDQVVKQIKPFTPLEIEVAALLKGSQNVLKNKKELTPAEERALKAMSLEEAKERRAELQRYRALMSYRETKAKRQKKIKSKKYHRILRKEREKEEKKALDIMKQKDPEGYVEKLQEADRNRIQERMSLKHRGGSKFARKTLMYAKFNQKDKQAVSDMIQKNRELTKKVDLDIDSDEGIEEDDVGEYSMTESGPSLIKGHNPWMSSRPQLGNPAVNETTENAEENELQTKSEHVDIDSEEESTGAEEISIVESEMSVLKGHNPWMDSQPQRSNTGVNESSEDNGGKERNLKNENEKVDDMAETDQLTGKNSNEINNSNKKTNQGDIEHGKQKKRKLKSSANISTEKKSKKQMEIGDDVSSKTNESSKKKRKKNLSENKSLEGKSRKKTETTSASKTDSESLQKQKKEIQKKSLVTDKDSEIDTIEDIFEKLNRPKISPSKPSGKKRSKSSLRNKNTEKQSEESMDEDSSDDDDGLTESLDRKTTLEDMDDLAKEPEGKPKQKKRKRKKKKKKAADKQPAETSTSGNTSVDSNKVLKVEKNITNTVLPDVVKDDGDDLDFEEQQRLIIEQAFADDDVVDEFAKEKSDIVDRDKPKDIDLTLPGWGEWGGAGVEPSAKKKKRFVIQAPRAPPRKDQNLGNVIISECKDTAIAKYQVSQLPYPCMNMKQFEQSIRAPIGKDWNPEMAFKKLVEPKVVTQLGTIISPIDKDDGPELLHQVFLEKGWLEYDEEIHDESDWNIWWKTSRFRTSDYDQINPWQRLNHYPNSVGITRKDFLARTLKRMKGVYGSGVYNFSPIAFNIPNDYTKFVAEYSKMKGLSTVNDKSLLWICKPVDMSRGRGIFLFRDLSELQYDCSAVIQRYVANPFLIGGYKFDIRIYVAVPSFHPLTVYIHQEGLVRFSTEKFSLDSINNIFAHLTNTSINKHSPSYTHDKERVGPGCKWTLLQLRYYFHQKGIDDGKIWLRIINIVILTLITQAPSVPKVENCFELYGFDILIDDNLKPWLLEVNFSPALASDCQADILVKKPLLHDLMEMLNFKSTDADRGAHLASKCSTNTKSDRYASLSMTSRHYTPRYVGMSNSDILKRQSNAKDKRLSDAASENEGSESVEQHPIFGLPLVHHSDDEGIDETPESAMDASNSHDLHNESTGAIHSSLLNGYEVTGSKIEDIPEGIPVSMTRTNSGNSWTRKENGNKHTTNSARSRNSYKTQPGYGLQKGHSKSSTISDSGISTFSGSSENSDRVKKPNSDGESCPSLQSKTGSGDPVALSPDKDKTLTKDGKTVSVQWQAMTRKPGLPGLARLVKNPLNSKSTRFSTVTKTGKNALVRSQERGPGAAGHVLGKDKAGGLMHMKDKAGGLMHMKDKAEAIAACQSTPSLNKLITSKTKLSSSIPDLLHLPKVSSSRLPNPKPVAVNQHRTGILKPSLRMSRSHFVKSTPPPPKEAPECIGEFYLVFPFNEVTKKASQPVLDARAIIRETQKLIKESAKTKGKSSGKGQGQGQTSASEEPVDRLWGPLKGT
ncbi:uncharacterized protein LOC121370976 [Gigantopelta aegis]|uniref:uncharacterized protein LOC121370976 n=1 Tax=Gigantopelta aegis TaxID=1735272 RepID=UPI001B8880D3|nr:uncharacterized protein LOC121370976 [Gigantopelta aegis]